MRQPHSKVPLDPKFVAAVRSSGLSLTSIAALADYPNFTTLSTHLGTSVPQTPLNRIRLQKVAEIVRHDGKVWS